jgi:hypothetical protein
MIGNEVQKLGKQFRYWDLRRKGETQSEISRKFGISRQSVNKSIKLFESEVMYRLIETARSSGTLVEWFDASKGVLIGITPQLGDLRCLILLDNQNKIRTFHDQTKNENREMAASIMGDLKESIKASIGMDLREETTFKSVLGSIYK